MSSIFEITDLQTSLGVGSTGFGLFYLFLGMLLQDNGLLAASNILLIVGLSCVVGVIRTLKFFFQRQKIKASMSFFGGISMVLLRWPILGMLLEIYGLVILFR